MPPDLLPECAAAPSPTVPPQALRPARAPTGGPATAAGPRQPPPESAPWWPRTTAPQHRPGAARALAPRAPPHPGWQSWPCSTRSPRPALRAPRHGARPAAAAQDAPGTGSAAAQAPAAPPPAGPAPRPTRAGAAPAAAQATPAPPAPVHRAPRQAAASRGRNGAAHRAQPAALWPPPPMPHQKAGCAYKLRRSHRQATGRPRWSRPGHQSGHAHTRPRPAPPPRPRPLPPAPCPPTGLPPRHPAR